jgi:hypothetical protein
MVSCYMKRRLSPDLFPDDLNCLLNTFDCLVTVVGDERLPPASINRLPASMVSSHVSWPCVSYSPTFIFSSNQTWARTRRAEVRRTTPATSGSASQVPPLEDFGDSEYSEEEFSSESERSSVYASPPVSSDDSDNS